MTFRTLIRHVLPVQNGLSLTETEEIPTGISEEEEFSEEEEEEEEEEFERLQQNEKKKKSTKAKRIEGVTEIPESSAYVAHLASYPALAAINGMLSSFPVVKIFTSNGIPLMMYMNENNEEKASASKK